MPARILVDLIHTHTQNPRDHRLAWDHFDYDSIHSFYRLFEHLALNGYPWDVIEEGELTLEILKQYDILFINLLNAEDPPFSAQEMAAIHAYLSPEHGGSVFIIADHTNCYGHAEKLNPLLQPYRIRVEYTSAIETMENCVAHYAWISISRFDTQHPVNQGIKRISFQLGGTLTTEHGTAFLSPDAFGDYWNPKRAPNYIGDKRLTLDETLEPRGSLPVVACLENIGGPGGGKIAVVADQNIYGDIWCHYHDNFKHGLNIFEWLAGDAGKAATPLRDTRIKGIRVGIDSVYSDNTAGRAEPTDFYSFFVNLNRDPGISAQVIDDDFTSDRLSNLDVLIIPPIKHAFLPVETLQAFMNADPKKILVLMFEIDHMNAETKALLDALAPDFKFRTADLADGPTVQIHDNLILWIHSNVLTNQYTTKNEAHIPSEQALPYIALQREFIDYLKSLFA